MPHFHAVQHVGGAVHGPECAEVPAEFVTNGLKDLGGGIGERGGLGQDACHRVLHRHTPFRILALRDIDDRSMDDRLASFLFQAHVGQHVNRRAILVAKAELMTEERALLLQLGEESLAVRSGVVELPRRIGLDLLARGVAEHARESFVAIQDLSLERGAEYPRHVAFKQQAVAVFRGGQFFHGSAPLPPYLRLAQLPFDRGEQPGAGCSS